MWSRVEVETLSITIWLVGPSIIQHRHHRNYALGNAFCDVGSILLSFSITFRVRWEAAIDVQNRAEFASSHGVPRVDHMRIYDMIITTMGANMI